MALIVTQGVLVRLIWGVGGQPTAVNVMGGINTGAAIDQGRANSIGAAIKASTAGASGLHQIMGTTVSLLNVGVRSIGAPSQTEFLDAGAAVPGTATGNLLPAQVALCITLRTALAGKSYRGRFYTFGFTATSLTPGGLCSTVVGDQARTAVEGLITALATSQITPAIISREKSLASPITLVNLRDYRFDTIRKRAIPGI